MIHPAPRRRPSLSSASPPALGILSREVSWPQDTCHGVCLSCCHGNTRMVHTHLWLVPEGQVPCLLPRVWPPSPQAGATMWLFWEAGWLLGWAGGREASEGLLA